MRGTLLSSFNQLGILDVRANSLNALADGQRPDFVVEGESITDDTIAARGSLQPVNGSDVPRDPAITYNGTKKRRARPGDVTEAARTALGRLLPSSSLIDN